MFRVKEACVLIMLSPEESKQLRVQVSEALRQQRQQQEKKAATSEDTQKLRKRFNVHKLTFSQMKNVLDVCIIEEQQSTATAADDSKNNQETGDL